MEKMKTKLFAMLIAVTMVFAMAPLTAGIAFADDEAADQTGTETTQDVTETDATQPGEADADSVESEVTEESAEEAAKGEVPAGETKYILPENPIFAINGKRIDKTSAKGKGWTFKLKKGVGYLTLNKATITKTFDDPNGYGDNGNIYKYGIYADGMDLKITLKGKNKMSSTYAGYIAVNCENGKLTFNGKGYLTINTPFYGTFSGGDTVISKTRVYVTQTGPETTYGNGIEAYGKLSIYRSKVSVKNIDFNGFSCDNLSISRSTVNINAGNDGARSDKNVTIVNSKVTTTGVGGYGLYGGGIQGSDWAMTIKDSNVNAKGEYGGISNFGTLYLVKTSKGKYSTRLESTSTDDYYSSVTTRGFSIDKFRFIEPVGAKFGNNNGWTDIVDQNGVSAPHVVLVPKKSNTLSIKARTATVKYSLLKTEDQTLPVTKVVKFTKKGYGDRTYTKTSGSSKILVDETTGDVTVKTGLKRGTYKFKIKVTAAGNDTYLAKSKTVKATIKVK